MTERIEETILRNLICNEQYYRKVVPFIKADYFQEYNEKILFEEIADFAAKYLSLIHISEPTRPY